MSTPETGLTAETFQDGVDAIRAAWERQHTVRYICANCGEKFGPPCNYILAGGKIFCVGREPDCFRAAYAAHLKHQLRGENGN